MNKSNRDIYLLSPHGLSNPNEHELDSMHAQLFEAERIQAFARAHEYIDAARNQIHRNQVLIKRHIRSKQEIPFVFLNCLN
jgi:hypothetical protein